MKKMFLKLLLVGCGQMVPQKALLLGTQISLMIQGIHFILLKKQVCNLVECIVTIHLPVTDTGIPL